MIDIIKIDIHGTAQQLQVEPTLEAFRELLDGGDLEAIGGPDWNAYFDEEGKLKGLPVNRAADLLARRLGWDSLPGDVLVGPVVFLGPPDEDGVDTSAPEELVREAVTASLA
jgi:hypothetical protein